MTDPDRGITLTITNGGYAPANVPPVADERGGTVAGMIFFTDNYQDRSTNDGYQFEFFCRRCGNGYSSSFQHSVTGFGRRLFSPASDLGGGAVGVPGSGSGLEDGGSSDGQVGATPAN